MTTYTIKPLKWECISEFRWVADSIIGRFVVRSGNRIEWYLGDTDDVHRCNSIDDGKAKAESYYRERLMGALEPVPDGAQVGGVHYHPEPDHDRPPGAQRP